MASLRPLCPPPVEGVVSCICKTSRFPDLRKVLASALTAAFLYIPLSLKPEVFSPLQRNTKGLLARSLEGQDPDEGVMMVRSLEWEEHELEQVPCWLLL